MQHLAVIPDGNRRWALQNKLASLFGHQKGLDVTWAAFQFCIKQGIKYFSIYTFSIENFRRDAAEKKYLFQLIIDGFSKHTDDFLKYGIRINFIGDRALFPDQVTTVIEQVEQATKHLDTLVVNILFCYGATAEITAAVKAIASQVSNGTMQIGDITEEVVRSALWTKDTPSPDLILRTGGVSRLSNFLLYQAAYSEFIFLDDYWPALTEKHFEQCLEKFNSIKRNFGS
jgi:undecaprenyl diphosphate synthase